MHYFDTSFIAPLILEEASSVAVEKFVLSLPSGTLAVSHWTRVEFSSLIARKVRTATLTESEAHAAIAQFDHIVAESFDSFIPSAAAYDLAI